MTTPQQRLTHKVRLLKALYETRLKLTATDFSYVSNANQYFAELEHQDLITSEWGDKGSAKVKFRFIAEKQSKKAEKYLKAFGGLKPNANRIH
ncbi:MAG: hypothetical protein LBF13_04205 [Campylobacteraceae bacterium]|jgi:hypothetical protein|nr:hypothetical protein [Campylobacteraceae bacterium]